MMMSCPAASGPDSAECRTLRGQTPLFVAVENGLIENASYLLQHGSQPDPQDLEQDSPLLVGRPHQNLLPPPSVGWTLTIIPPSHLVLK